MKFTSELKIGLIGIGTLVVLIWGINYLKGRNILKNTYTLHAFYDNALTLESSAAVMMNGVKIGYVHEVRMSPDRQPPVEVLLSIEKDYPIPGGSMAVLFSADLLGTKSIRVDMALNTMRLVDGDTIGSAVEADMLSAIQSSLVPTIEQVSELAVSLDRLAGEVDTLIGSEATRETLENLSAISGSLNASLGPRGPLNQSFRNLESFSSMLEAQESELSSLIQHLNSISSTLDSSGIGNLTAELLSVSRQFNMILEQVNSGRGSAGSLLYSDSLHLGLENLISDLDRLITDLNENPQDYIHFSLFGNSKKKKR